MAAPPEFPSRGHVYGLEIETPFEIPTLNPGRENGSARRVRIEPADSRALEAMWKQGEGDWYFDDTGVNGRRTVVLEHHPQLGFRIWAARHGRHVVSNDGTVVRSALPGGPPWRWQRLLFAQVLPVAAMLQGLELFHASGIAVGDRVAAFVAVSGTGKSSVASHLVAGGADFVTDDVLSLDLEGEEIKAHAGPALAGLHQAELRSVPREERGRIGVVVGRSDKLVLNTKPATGPLQLGVVYFLKRSDSAAKTRITHLDPPDPRQLLASMFLTYVRTPERMTNLLAVCAAIARSTPVCEVVSGNSSSARELAQEVRTHINGLLP